MLRTSARERSRYREAHFRHWPDFELYRERGARWLGFEAVDQLRGLPPEILLVPLFGHTRGHAGVAVKADEGWLLHAGDAYFHHVEMLDGHHAPRLLALFQRVDDMDHRARVENQRRLRALARSGEARVFCAHDPHELSRFGTR
jgi:glyoxylase-like metal-dependent hydrolase (beta-lactamase superfamily II)